MRGSRIKRHIFPGVILLFSLAMCTACDSKDDSRTVKDFEIRRMVQTGGVELKEWGSEEVHRVANQALIVASDVEDAWVQNEPEPGEQVILIELKADAAQRFHELTAELIAEDDSQPENHWKRRLCLIAGGRALVCPRILEAISGGRLSLTLPPGELGDEVEAIAFPRK